MGCNKRYTDPSSLRKHVKNHSKEEQEQVKMVRDSGSQGRSTDNIMEGWLDTEGPNLALLCPLIGQHTGTQGAAIGQSPAPGYTEEGASGQYDQLCRRPDMASTTHNNEVIINTEVRSVEVNKKGLYFAFPDQGACLSLLAIKVYYKTCP